MSYGFDPYGTPYLSRNEVLQPPVNPDRERLVGLQGQVAARQQAMQQPLTPEGQSLKQAFTSDLERIQDMQSSGYPTQHVADYLNQSLQKLDSRWSPSYVRQVPAFDEVAKQLTGIIPVTGTAGHIIYRNGEPQIKEFDSQKGGEEEAAGGSAGSMPPGLLGRPDTMLAAAAMGAASPSGDGQNYGGLMVEGGQAPPGHNLPVISSPDDYQRFPGGYWVDYRGTIRRKPTQAEWDDATMRRDLGEETHRIVSEGIQVGGKTYKVPVRRNAKTGRWEAPDAWKAKEFEIKQKQEAEKAQYEREHPKGSEITADQAVTYANQALTTRSEHLRKRADAIGKRATELEKQGHRPMDAAEIATEEVNAYMPADMYDDSAEYWYNRAYGGALQVPWKKGQKPQVNPAAQPAPQQQPQSAAPAQRRYRYNPTTGQLEPM